MESKIVVEHTLEINNTDDDEGIPTLDGEVIDDRFAGSEDARSTDKPGGNSKYGTFINKGVFIDTINGNFTFKK